MWGSTVWSCILKSKGNSGVHRHLRRQTVTISASAAAVPSLSRFRPFVRGLQGNRVLKMNADLVMQVITKLNLRSHNFNHSLPDHFFWTYRTLEFHGPGREYASYLAGFSKPGLDKERASGFGNKREIRKARVKSFGWPSVEVTRVQIWADKEWCMGSEVRHDLN